jgi:hypothetical protein
MIVTMTSWAPVRAFRSPGTKPHSAPPRKPAPTASGRWTNIGSPCRENPTKVATIAPTYSCPSAPMLNRPLRKPRATARPVKMSGVAARSDSLTGLKALLIWPRSPLANAAAYVSGLPRPPVKSAP